MPVYSIRCNDQNHHQCEEEVRVKLDIVGLTETQIEAIEEGRPINLTPRQVEGSDLTLSETQSASLAAEGVLEYRIDIESICDTCGGAFGDDE
ncbi:MAG TPA: hypothetical protein ENI17_02090 [Pseudomonas xinjiangensis]|uniref:Uncharacterized protein n=2 Tax=root TaxID=1 RepID=A0A7V1FRB8_9GAMM|nr:hypothetical protein [Halopseudomonas xinjiangensis]HEC46403.1 hypothetical protein [Halopseudomonas xinjiangensis]